MSDSSYSAAADPVQHAGLDADDFERREGGAIWLHRQILSSAVWTLPDAQLRVFITLLLVANWKPTEVVVHGHRVVVKRGQTLITVRKLAEKARVSKGVVECARTALLDLKVIRVEPAYDGGGQKSGQVPHLTTVVNYEKFQARALSSPDKKPDKSRDKSRDRNRDTDRDDQKKGNKGEKVEKEKKHPPPPAASGGASHQELIDALVAEYQREKDGAKYAVMGRDLTAVKKLLAYSNGSTAEAVRRFRRMLRETKVLKNSGSTIWELEAKWNALQKKTDTEGGKWMLCSDCGEVVCNCPKLTRQEKEERNRQQEAAMERARERERLQWDEDLKRRRERPDTDRLPPLKEGEKDLLELTHEWLRMQHLPPK